MKLYHFGLIFIVIATGFLVTAQICSVTSIKEEEIRRTEYDCLVAAVNAAAGVAFSGGENRVTASGLQQAEEVFFQTLSVLHGGTPDAEERAVWREYVPCLVVFDETGYYRYSYVPEQGYVWSAVRIEQKEEIPESFFSETEELLSRYHALHVSSAKKYRMERAGGGVWEQSLSRACVFAVYAPKLPEPAGRRQGIFLYAAAQRVREAYFVTEDNYCHLPSCSRCEKSRIIARYATQKESAQDGAVPCAGCLKEIEEP